MTPLSLTESWEMEGRRLAPLLDGICSVVIAATDSDDYLIDHQGRVIGKAGISYAGTWVVGHALERLYKVGGNLTGSERKKVYDEGLQRGKQIAQKFLETVRAARVKK